MRKEALRRQFGVDFESREGRAGGLRRNCRTVFDLITVLDLEFWGQVTGFPNLVSEKEKRDMDRKVQVKENYRQRRNGKVWDTVLSDYEGVEFEGNLRIDGFLYALAIKGVF